MAETYTPNCRLRIPALNDPWEAPLDANRQWLDGCQSIGGLAAVIAETPSSTLHVTVAPGVFRKGDGTVGTYAGGTFTAPASAVTCLWCTEAGVLTSGVSFPSTAAVRIATVTAGASTITGIADARVPFSSTSAGLALYLLKAGDTFGDPANFVLGTTTGTQLGTAVGQKLGLWGVTPVVQPLGANQGAITDSTGGTLADYVLAAGVLTDSTGGTATTTLAVATNTATLTDSTGGTATTTLAAITDTATKNAMASLAAQLATQRALNIVLINAVASLALQANTSNNSISKLARLATAVRSALVSVGIIKGSA